MKCVACVSVFGLLLMGAIAAPQGGVHIRELTEK